MKNKFTFLHKPLSLSTHKPSFSFGLKKLLYKINIQTCTPSNRLSFQERSLTRNFKILETRKKLVQAIVRT